MKVLNFGSLNIDYVYQVPHFVRAGETLSSFSRETFCGGKGTNQSIAASKGGAQVWHAGAVGKDDSQMLMDALQEAGVHTEFVKRLDGSSGHAIIQKNPDGQNCILLYGGANQEITKEHVDEVLAHFDRGDFLILQNEINQMPYIMEQAHKRGMQIVLNPSPMNEKILECPLEYVDYFMLNEVEGADICGKEASGEEMLNQLLEKFPGSKVVLTLGEQGSLYGDGKESYQQGIFKVKVADTTAAGDTFTGFFISSLIRGCGVKEALETAAKASAIAVSRNGAGPSIPTLKEVQGCGL